MPEYPWYERTVTSSDYVEGSKAFIEKRDPEWTDFGEDILAREQASMNEQEDRAKSSLAQVLGKRENV